MLFSISLSIKKLEVYDSNNPHIIALEVPAIFFFGRHISLWFYFFSPNVRAPRKRREFLKVQRILSPKSALRSSVIAAQFREKTNQSVDWSIQRFNICEISVFFLFFQINFFYWYDLFVCSLKRTHFRCVFRDTWISERELKSNRSPARFHRIHRSLASFHHF